MIFIKVFFEFYIISLSCLFSFLKNRCAMITRHLQLSMKEE